MSALVQGHVWNAGATRFVALNVAGGVAVLASYAWGFAQLGDDMPRAWGGVPESMKPLYQTSMLLAAAGYFPMTIFVLNRVRRRCETSASAQWLYAGILVGSALWLPLTCRMLDSPGPTLWWAIRGDLALVATCSLAVLGLVARDKPKPASSLWTAAAVGAALFCIQTALLDAVVWPAYFPAGR